MSVREVRDADAYGRNEVGYRTLNWLPFATLGPRIPPSVLVPER